MHPNIYRLAYSQRYNIFCINSQSVGPGFESLKVHHYKTLVNVDFTRVFTILISCKIRLNLIEFL